MNHNSISTGYFGKQPNFADFISFNSANDEIKLFDQWIQKGVSIAKSRLLNRFDALYTEMPVYRFLFPSESGFSLAGCLYPGYDASGRKFPFITYCRFSNTAVLDSQFKLMPLFMKDMIHSFDSFYEESKYINNSSGLSEKFSSVPPAGLFNHESFYDYQVYINKTAIDRFWIEPISDPEIRRLFFKYLFELYSDANYSRAQILTLGIKLQFSPDAEYALYNISIWNEIISKLIKNPSVKPFLFWEKTKAEEISNIYVYLKSPAPENFIALMGEESMVDSLCDLTSSESLNFASTLNSAPAQFINDTKITIREFIERLKQ